MSEQSGATRAWVKRRDSSAAVKRADVRPLLVVTPIAARHESGARAMAEAWSTMELQLAIGLAVFVCEIAAKCTGCSPGGGALLGFAHR
jgi:hypothetical protein